MALPNFLSKRNLVLFLVSLTLLAFLSSASEEGNGGETGVKKKEEVKWPERDERRWVTLCWKQKMNGCLLECEERKAWLIPETARDLILTWMYPEYKERVDNEKKEEQKGPFGIPLPPPKTNETSPIEWLRVEYPEWEILDEMCGANCQGLVSWKCSEANLLSGGSQIFKFGGRWPFRPLWFIIEPASSLFALFTALLQISGFLDNFRSFKAFDLKTGGKFSQEVKPKMIILGKTLWVSTLLSACIFHSFDITLTERLDYFTIFLALMAETLNALVYILDVRKTRGAVALGIPLLVFAAYHIHYMSYVKFDYGYHNTVCITVAVTNSLLWCLWIAQNKRHPGVRDLVFSQIFFPFFAVFEIFDFAPLWGVFDGHALWHLSINLIISYFNSFIVLDMIFVSDRVLAEINASPLPEPSPKTLDDLIDDDEVDDDDDDDDDEDDPDDDADEDADDLDDDSYLKSKTD